MSTKYAETHEDDNRRKSICAMCASTFISHSEYERNLIAFPDNICVWCFTRCQGRLHKRYKMMWDALDAAVQSHEKSCECYGCKVHRVALPVMRGTIQESET